MMTVVVAGGGFAGAETAGAVNDFSARGVISIPAESMLASFKCIRATSSSGVKRKPRALRLTQLKQRGVDVRLRTGVAKHSSKELALTVARITTRRSSGPPGLHRRR